MLASFVSAASAQRQATTVTAPADVAAAPADASRNSSGLATKVLKPGTGTEHPEKDELVLVDYTGWTSDGKVSTQHSSMARGR